MYSFDAGRIRYGSFETDAAFFCARQQDGETYAAFSEGTRLCYQEVPLYQGKPHRLFQEDASNNIVSPTWRERWEGTISDR